MFSQQLLQDSSVPGNVDSVEVLVINNSLFTVYVIENTCGNICLVSSYYRTALFL